jgi:hypothetical protein
VLDDPEPVSPDEPAELPPVPIDEPVEPLPAELAPVPSVLDEPEESAPAELPPVPSVELAVPFAAVLPPVPSVVLDCAWTMNGLPASNAAARTETRSLFNLICFSLIV